MRIIGGEFRGVRLRTRKGRQTRPTAERTREALFSILHSADGCQLAGARIMDICAGTGALGLEALSRGGDFCLFIEQSHDACAIIRANCAALGVEAQCHLLRRDATSLGASPSISLGVPPSALSAALSARVASGFNLVFIDPPYGKGLGADIMATLAAHHWLAPQATLILEEDRRSSVPSLSAFELTDKRVYGDTQLIFYRAL